MLMPVGMVESFSWSVPRSISADRCTPFRVSTAWMMRSGIPFHPRVPSLQRNPRKSLSPTYPNLSARLRLRSSMAWRMPAGS